MERKLTAILSADVKGYSRLMGDDEVATIRTLTAYREVMATLIQQHRGRVIDSPGDNLLAEFASAVDAVQGAMEIQRELKVKNTDLPDSRKMEFRIGINVGDVIVEGERLYGDGVNIAARLEGLAEPGGICISGTVYDQIETKLMLSYEYLGEQAVKNIAKPVRVWRVHAEPKASSSTVSSKGEIPPPLLLPDKPSIAVLPFVNLSSDPEQEYFKDGMTDTLITDLSQLSGLFVIARNSAFTYKGKPVKVQEVSKELGVRYVLEGSVQKANNRVRINVQLIDATMSGHLWAERYDRELKDIFALQDEVTQRVVAALRVQLTEEEQEHLVRKNTDNVEAYDSLLRGWTYYLRYTKEANAQARQMFEHAIELDSQYADAYTGLGATYWIEWILQWSQKPAHSLERFAELTHQALALDDSRPLPHSLLGYIYLWKDRQVGQGIAELQKAVSLAPNNADAYFVLAEGLNIVGRHTEALGPIHKAMRLNPHYPAPYPFNLGWAYQGTGQVEEALAAYKRAVNLNPDFLPTHLQLADLYSDLGREEEARTEAAEILRISPNFSVEEWRQGSPYADRARLERFVANLRKAGLN